VKPIPGSQTLVTALDATLRPASRVPARKRFAVAIEELRYVVGTSVPRAALKR
jgi:hypothetical protein